MGDEEGLSINEYPPLDYCGTHSQERFHDASSSPPSPEESAASNKPDIFLSDRVPNQTSLYMRLAV